MTSPPVRHLAGYAAVALSSIVATAAYVGGSPTSPPPPISTPIADPIVLPGMVAQQFSWAPSEGATGYRIYLDGVITGNVPGTWKAAVLSVKCGVRHRFNAQPFNAKGLAALAPPVYVTTPCPVAP